MAWNGSGSGKSTPINKKNSKPNKVSSGAPMSGAFKGIVLLFVVVLMGCLAYICFVNDEVVDKVKEKLPRNRAIKEVQADIADSVEIEEEKSSEKPIEKKPRVKPDSVLPDENGVLRWPSGARYIEDYSFRTNAINPYKGQKQLFKHGSEIHIATLLEVKPGNMIISGFEYGPQFDKNFINSLEEEIEFLDDDTEEERQLKEDVIAVKKDLKAALDRGEKPSEIMQEAREELIQAFQYKHNLEQQLMAIRQDPTMSAQDIIDSYDAANMMLEEKGIPGFSTSGVMKRRLEKLKQQELKAKGY